MENNLETLFAADPQLAEAVNARLTHKQTPVDSQTIEILVAESIRSLCQEISFGRAVGRGLAELAGRVDRQRLLAYRDIVRQAACEGPTLGRIMATHLVPVFVHGDRSLLEHFMAVAGVMRAKGTYTLNRPLEALSALLRSGDRKSARAYLALLETAFSRDLNYNQCLRFTSLLPEAAAVFDAEKKAWQFEQLQRVIRIDHQLASALLEGMQKGLQRLDRPALEEFVGLGLEKYRQHAGRGGRFLALDSKSAQDAYRRMRISVGLDEVQPRLTRYLNARTAMSLAVRPLSALPQKFAPARRSDLAVCSDGRFIYLPEEIGTFARRADNLQLYQALTRLEAAFYEFSTFEFDLEKALEQCLDGSAATMPPPGGNKFADCLENLQQGGPGAAAGKEGCDLQQFFDLFVLPELAADLFAIFELARLRVLLTQCYPGLIRRVMPLLRREARRLFKAGGSEHPLQALYLRLVAGADLIGGHKGGANSRAFAEEAAGLWQAAAGAKLPVETGARIVYQVYGQAVVLAGGFADGLPAGHHYRSLPMPFGWRPRPELFRSARPQIDQLAARLKALLARRGLAVYRSELKLRLQAQNGQLTARDIRKFAGSRMPVGLNLEQLLDDAGGCRCSDCAADAGGSPVFWYREWDCRLADYLQHHVRVLERQVQGPANDFFQRVLQRHRGLIQRMRQAFELLKPRGLTVLRQWPDGDEFDYRALLDYALDRRAGIRPSERLYIKRVKKRRDVAVLLLVDLSRSTANRVPGSAATVLEVEKEAIVILTQALEVLGDTFSIAGFSGNGRLGVDYFRLKDFDENMDEAVRKRIGAIGAQRNTRMGAAVRHAAVALGRVPARVRLLIVLGDGFPNDLDYKRRYAVEDTRRALFELRAKNIYTHAITVNQAADPELDGLYGHIHHSLISDVRQLPDKLVWLYGRLTRA